MKPRDIFSLTLRFVGMLGILYVVNHMNYVWHKSGSLFVWQEGASLLAQHRAASPHEHSLLQFIFEVILILIGVYMICGCPLFMKIMFPDRKSRSADDEAAGETN